MLNTKKVASLIRRLLKAAPHHVDSLQGKIPAHQVPSHPERIPGAPSYQNVFFENVRVLVADQDIPHCQRISNHLSSWGIESFNAANGMQALETARSFAEFGKPFDIALLEMHLAGICAFELAILFQNDFLASKIALILLNSGRPPESRIIHAAGFHACLAKPVQESQLNGVIAEIVNIRRSSPSGIPDSSNRRAKNFSASLQ